MRVVSLIIDTEWIGASDPRSVAAKDYRSFLTLVEDACRWTWRGARSNDSSISRALMTTVGASSTGSCLQPSRCRPITPTQDHKRNAMLCHCRYVDPDDYMAGATAALVALIEHQKLHVAAAALCALGTKLQQPSPQVTMRPCMAQGILQCAQAPAREGLSAN